MWLRGIKENRKWKEVSGVDAVCLFWSGLHRSPGHWRLRDAGTGGVDHPPVSHEGEVGGERERWVLRLGRDQALRSREDMSEAFQEETKRFRVGHFWQTILSIERNKRYIHWPDPSQKAYRETDSPIAELSVRTAKTQVNASTHSWRRTYGEASSLSMAPCVAANEDGLRSKTHLNVLTIKRRDTGIA
ncbi:unnamed protein product [Leuciscus chuanchicus]